MVPFPFPARQTVRILPHLANLLCYEPAVKIKRREEGVSSQFQGICGSRRVEALISSASTLRRFHHPACG